MLELLKLIDDPIVRVQIESERAFLKQIGGGCSIPVGALAKVDDNNLKLIGCVASLDGSSERDRCS